jgi:hypothetical protein
MNEGTMLSLTKLIEGGGTAFERDLFASIRADQVPSGSRARVAANLGLASLPTTGERSGSCEVPAVPPASSAAVGAAPRLTARLACVGKYTLIGLVAGLGSLRAAYPAATQEERGPARAARLWRTRPPTTRSGEAAQCRPRRSSRIHPSHLRKHGSRWYRARRLRSGAPSPVRDPSLRSIGERGAP